MTVEWMMTEPHPWKRAHVHGADQGRLGWRWHAVPASDEGKRRPALCGLRPSHGWGGDIFANEMCERCRLAVIRRGIALPDWLERSSVAEYKERRKAEAAPTNGR